MKKAISALIYYGANADTLRAMFGTISLGLGILCREDKYINLKKK